MNLNQMNLLEKRQLAAELTPFILEELRENSAIILQEEDRAKKIKVRIVDSGLVSGCTHDDLDAASAAYAAATNVESRKTALTSILGIFRTILLGHNK